MNVTVKPRVLEESMRIAGKKVSSERGFEVLNPYDGSVVGTVPLASVKQIRETYDKVAGYKATLSRHDRSKILRKAAEILDTRRQDIAALITAESGLSMQDTLYEVGRAFDVFVLSSTLCLQDDGQIFSCDLTPHGQKRRIYTQRDPLRCITAITPFNLSLIHI